MLATLAMRVCALTLVSLYSLLAARSTATGVRYQAQTDFDKVEMAPIPALGDTATSVQSQAAALLPASAPEELSAGVLPKGLLHAGRGNHQGQQSRIPIRSGGVRSCHRGLAGATRT